MAWTIRKHVTTSVLVGFMAAATMVVGCSKSSEGGGNTAPVAPTALPTCTDPTCLAAQGTNYIVLSPYAQQSLIAYNNQLVMGMYDTSYYFNLSSMTTSSYVPVLRDAMGVCDREYYSGGMASCSSWISAAHAITLSAPTINGAPSTNPPSVNLNFWSTPRNDDPFFYSYQAPQLKYLLFGLLGVPMPSNPAGYFNPMPMQATFWPVNNSQGFEVRANGPTGSPSQTQLFQFQVAVGKIGDPTLSFVLHLNGRQVSTGRMILCQTPNCQNGY